MKKVLGLALALMVSASAWAVPSASNYTNFPGGLGTGSVGSGTYMVLTGVSEVYVPIPLTSILTGTNGTTALADTAITTGLYVMGATGLSNTAAIGFPAVLDTPVASINVPGGVPWNYRSGGKLVVAWHTNSSFTAGTLSATADAYSYMYNGTTSTTKTSGTAVQIPTSASAWAVTQTVTNAIGLTPGAALVYKLSTAKTSAAAIPQIINAWFVYRPWGVVNGQ